jgi:proteasome-associated ATPase
VQEEPLEQLVEESEEGSESEPVLVIAPQDTVELPTPEGLSPKMLELEIENLRAKNLQQEELLNKLIEERNQLKANLGESSTRITALSVKLEELTEASRRVMMPPLSFGVVVLVSTEEGRADVIADGRRLRVGIHPSVAIHKLRRGQRVILNGTTMAIQRIADDVDRTGTQAHLSEWIDARTALIEDSRGDKRIVLVGDGLTPETLESGTEVLVDDSVIIHPLHRTERTSALGAGSRFLLAEMPDVTFDDIGGLDDELARIVASLENPQKVPEAYAALHRKPTLSIILLGLPGNGKTMIAKAIARRQFDLHREKITKYAKGNFFAVGGTELFSKWLGDTERFMREIVGAAQRLYKLTGATSTVFFDDCESFFLTRSAGLSTNINGSVVTQFSTLIEGVRELEGVNLIAATNRLDLMDPAVVRRFDRQLRIKTPDTPIRAGAVLQKHLRGIPFSGITTQEAIERLVADIFAPIKENEIVEILFRDSNEDPKIVRLSELISGKFLRDIVENAKELAIERVLAEASETRTWALTYDDLHRSLESELRNKESLPTTEAAIHEWLRQRDDKREVDSVVSLRETRKSEARRDRDIDSRVI